MWIRLINGIAGALAFAMAGGCRGPASPVGGSSEVGDAAVSASIASTPCPPSWMIAPPLDSDIAVPSGGGSLLLHVRGKGTQDYSCARSERDGGAQDGGSTFGWVFLGPEAILNDCSGVAVGRHLASGGNATRPEWMTWDGSVVIGKKLRATVIAPGSSASALPSLLLHALSNSETGILSKVRYIQRVNTTGGTAPSAVACDAARVGTIERVPYSADYYFFGE
jgi:uncharacterized protein DUF3455